MVFEGAIELLSGGCFQQVYDARDHLVTQYSLEQREDKWWSTLHGTSFATKNDIPKVRLRIPREACRVKVLIPGREPIWVDAPEDQGKAAITIKL